MLQYVVWDVDPICFSLGPISVRWYGVMWALGIWAVLYIMGRIYKQERIADVMLDKLFVYVLSGAIIGSRLGHCFFYEWHELATPVEFLGMTFRYGNEYFIHPWRLLFIWEGGLASHGGAIGILIAVWLYNRKWLKRGFVWLLDRLIIGVAICGACIRFGNLMNSEIFGYPTTLPWGFMFLRSYEWQQLYSGQACHPTQIYEMIYCLVTFVVCALMYWKWNAGKHTGLLLGVFWLGIFGTRFVLEFIKNNQEDFESYFALNMGQVLSLPFIVWGVYLIVSVIVRMRKQQ